MNGLKKKSCLLAKLIKFAAIIASIGGVLFLFKDTITDIISSAKDHFAADDDFEDFDDDDEMDDFDDEEVFDHKSDREYVSINITDEEAEDSKDMEDPEESDDTEENA